MKKAIFALLIIAAFSCFSLAQDEPVFTDEDLGGYEDSSMTLTGTETTEAAPSYSQYEHYLKGNRLDTRWLTVSDVTPIVTRTPLAEGDVAVNGYIEFKVRSTYDTPANRSFAVLYSFKLVSPVSAFDSDTGEQKTIYLTSGNFNEQTPGYGSYEKTVKTNIYYTDNDLTRYNVQVRIWDIKVQ